MASIDKTYTNSYKDYKQFKDWADKQIVTFYDGYKECIGDYVWDLEESDFGENEIPIMNTPQWLDAYLLQHCKVQFVLDRMNQVYRKKSIEKMLQIDFAKLPDGYRKKRKIYINNNEFTSIPLSSKYTKDVKYWYLQSFGCYYNENSKRWCLHKDFYPINTDTAHLKSIKAVIKHLRNQYLPSGVEFTLSGKYVGQCYTINVI